MSVANKALRDTIRVNNLRQWEVANAIGISDSRLSVWLRTPLNHERKARVEKAIAKLTSGEPIEDDLKGATK